MDKLLQKLQRAQHKMKQISDKGRTERVFSGGLCVFEIATLQAMNCGFKAASSLLRALTHYKSGKVGLWVAATGRVTAAPSLSCITSWEKIKQKSRH